CGVCRRSSRRPSQPTPRRRHRDPAPLDRAPLRDPSAGEGVVVFHAALARELVQRDHEQAEDLAVGAAQLRLGSTAHPDLGARDVQRPEQVLLAGLLEDRGERVWLRPLLQNLEPPTRPLFARRRQFSSRCRASRSWAFSFVFSSRSAAYSARASSRRASTARTWASSASSHGGVPLVPTTSEKRWLISRPSGRLGRPPSSRPTR